MREIFKATKDFDGSNWLIASFGDDQDGNSWYVTTDGVHASELPDYSEGADSDAKLIADLLNKHYSPARAELKQDVQKILNKLAGLVIHKDGKSDIELKELMELLNRVKGGLK